ncbi:bifunctional 4-hydroxy-2-oxoglutarate aldolase/2-dehydro-3-deoxy-phosphogluconate aldolase [Anaerorhabdus furcosa]|uniref:2-dehydro-3-deoxy-phosphogluconate aldolase n=1 Tax=Anaerorhabdus furcosa TaxID=118967 RepID=A0A1T4KH04_9FIRM|nr:bifunctional 4-hydroxy-2-oxoglutarate aldolase/2-dehydro-3-deoxy-phosphogluconate aldolase [Anaerorhabdus furcosa]SJZ41708.1 2-dehydro-3-deoxyphosphogluconate aldolase / (4S)-4-hydroxy-2-oxoglutarate aldolase [Anaerorhabdus furcosa]
MHPILQELSNIGIIPVIRIDNPSDTLPMINALNKGGINCAEITFRSEHAKQAISDISKTYPEILVGAGTVLTIQQAQEAIEAGAKFIISPGLNEEVVKWCIDHDVLIIPGISTASEIEKAMTLGLDTVKFFPAESSGGAKRIKDLSAPYTKMHFIPTGGINQNNMHDYLSLPCVDAIGGSFMLPQELIDSKNWDGIEAKAKEAITSLLNYRLIHIGINTNSKDDASKYATLLSTCFGFKLYEKPKSTFAGEGFELLNAPGPGDHGHIAIYTPYPERAIYQLAKLGINVLEDTITRNKKTSKINFAYLDLDIAGFKFHLINPDVKM